ncbi:MAG: aminotransferase class III-fold pyridoxal phosphate-dependent enzyme [Candidatus Promineifilaceae bacterium]|nr:aminotransferase class III-fold pyridoxal phosphate-dependent enzyme [Candidatus Promineifilaceae bacterium]
MSTVQTREYSPLIAKLGDEYARYSPTSARLHNKAQMSLVDGTSHELRLVQPFPPCIVAAQGAWAKDADGHSILDLWQGHLANILGHNPEPITRVLAQNLAGGSGLQTGLISDLEIEAAELLCRLSGAERVRFTVTGSLATMYAVMLARAHTGRDLVLKVGGGWHGAQPWGLKGVGYQDGYQHMDSEGLPDVFGNEIIVTHLNEPQQLDDLFSQVGDRIACFIIEPVAVAGGVVPASVEYMRAARELTARHGAVLILDEVVTGFRFRAGDAGRLYNVQPDLAVFAKILGGGMPVAAVAGRTEILDLVSSANGARVKFSGGTYSAHPASLTAAITMMSYLADHEEQIYSRLADLGAKIRHLFESAFCEEGIEARCTGGGNEAIMGSCLWGVHFPLQENLSLDKPHLLHNPEFFDVSLRRSSVLTLALLLENVHIMRMHGAVTAAHTEEDILFLDLACRRVARRIKEFRETGRVIK